MTDIPTSIELKNGITINFIDQTNRYYGDFHRVKIDVIAKFPVNTTQLPKDVHAIAEECHGHMTYTTSLEQMGVQSADLKNVSTALIDNFVKTVGLYLEKDNFVESLLRKKLRR